MEFVNEGKPKQVRQDDGPGRFKWKLLKTGETIELIEDIGLRYGLKKMKVTDSNQELPKVTEGNIGEVKVETKQIDHSKNKNEEESYSKKLNDIKGIGKKTAKDIVKVFPNEKKLKNAISHDDELPFRDDVEIKLRKEYGK